MNKKEVITPTIYTREYYLTDNEGCEEYHAGLDDHMHDKFKRCLKLANIKKEDYVLDVGCGRGELVYYAIKEGAAKALGVDYSNAAIQITKETIQKLPKNLRHKAAAVVCHSENFQYPDKYNVIFFVEIAEHLHDWQLKETFEKFYAALEKNGKIIMITPNYLYENYLQPIKLYTGVFGRFWKYTARVFTKKFKPKTFAEYCQKIFKFKVNRGELNQQMHCNVLTPGRLKKHLSKFQVNIYCEEPSTHPIALLTKKWWGRDIITIATKK